MRVAVFAVLALAPALAAQTAGKASGRGAAANTSGRPLQLLRATMSQSEDGPAASSGFQPGDVAFFSFQVENYKVSPTGKVDLAGHMQVFDPKGTAVVPRDDEAIGTSISVEDKEWKPKFRLQIQLPSIAPPGTYRVRYEATDQQTHQSAVGELPFEVAGKGIEAAKTLTVRNFGFYRTQEEGEVPLKVVAYRAGDLLWVRFDVVGYKYGPQNAIDVSYDVAVMTPDGKQLFQQDNAATEKSQAFYPQPWVPGAFNLSLQSTMKPGTYTLVITARDGIGNQTTETRGDFRVE